MTNNKILEAIESSKDKAFEIWSKPNAGHEELMSVFDDLEAFLLSSIEQAQREAREKAIKDCVMSDGRLESELVKISLAEYKSTLLEKVEGLRKTQTWLNCQKHNLLTSTNELSKCEECSWEIDERETLFFNQALDQIESIIGEK